jgi:hypothetical protein
MRHRTRTIIAALAAMAVVAVAIATTASGRPQISYGSAAAVTTTATPAAVPASRLANDVLIARLATEKYATSLSAARAAGYSILTRMIPSMGYHFINPSIKTFDLRRPPILVYEHRGSGWQLGALEWVYPSVPAHPPLPGASYGAFGAACHYVDGTFVFAAAQSMCPGASPSTGARFNFWHPKLVTLHFWIWYPNPSGIYQGINPLVAPFH